MKKLKKWKLIKEEEISPSKWYPLYKHTVELPNGKTIDDYFISKLGDVSIVVAITENKEIIFVNQYKHGAGEIILELPAGRVDNKTPLEAATAELEEETGYISQKMESLGVIRTDPSKGNVKVNGFLAIDVKPEKEQNLEETEDIEVVLIPIKDLNQKIINGEIAASDTLAFLFLAKLKAPHLFE